MIKSTLIFRVVVFIVLLSFAGCVTSKIEYVESDKVPVEKTYRISQLYLKDGTIIDVKEKEAKLRLKYKGVSNVIVYYEDVNIERSVPLKDVARLKIEILESHLIGTVLVIIGTVAVAIFLALGLILAVGGLKMH
ncbi:MAG TPA: hypothetical protein PKE39_14600 [Ignavibacteria bacterium]|nr:hypothetical protein [Ignavibacteria bacterium]HMR00249.1 hypothetical protein [Ignavibacteria bacterium]